MALKRILLWDIPDEIMLVLEHPSGVVYQNQVGGNVCWQAEMEGVLSPLDVSTDSKDLIQNCSYPNGRQGITAEIADKIDALLASEPGARRVKVDRARLDQSWEAWVHVVVDSPESSAVDMPHPELGENVRVLLSCSPDTDDPYFGSAFGFGPGTRGVLTWPNSD